MSKPLKFGVVIPDWIPGFSTHVIYKGAYTFIETLAKIGRETGELDVFRVHTPSQLEECEALFIFHHTHTGWTQYEARTYTTLYLHLYREAESYNAYKFLWNVEPIPYFNSAHSKYWNTHVDTILYSSVSPHLFYQCFPDMRADFIYVGNPCTLDIQKKPKLVDTISAPMTVEQNSRQMMWTGVLNDTYAIAGSRVELMVKMYGGLPVKVHCFGAGWHKLRDTLPSNFYQMPKVMGPDAYDPYPYILEFAELDRAETLNSIGWHSDRLGLALSGNAHLVSNMTWSSKVYQSVRSHEWLSGYIKTHGKLPPANASDLEADRQMFNYDAVVRRIYPAIMSRILAHGSNRRPTISDSVPKADERFSTESR